mgnify:FL=1
MSTQKAYLSVEGLRGLLALSVCLGHFGLVTLFERVGLQLNFHYAVDLFFVISGLVLARSNYFAAPSISTPLFLLKRMARLYPLHLITLLMMLGLNVFRGNSLNPQSLIENVFLIHNIGLSTFNNTFNFPSWSISVEICCTLIGFLLTQWVRKISTLTFILLAYVIFQSL